ncbi:MAG: anti-sigma factor [Thiotrichales bacterium]|nr:anti-sigma factor [Thiotrichales bacterium]
MKRTTQEKQLLAGEYVLGSLNEQERQDFEKEMAQDSALQKMVNDWQMQFLPLNDALPPVKPSRPLSARIERSLDALSEHHVQDKNRSTEPASALAVQGWTKFWQSLHVWQGIAAACFLASVILGVKVQLAPEAAGETVYMAVLVAPQDKSPGWVIQASESNKIQLTPLGAVQIPEGKALQFWTKADGWNAPVSLGLVKKGETLTVNLDSLPPLEENQLFELTVEEETGSPTGKPTGPIQSIGRAVLTL